MWLFVNNHPCFGYIQITTLNNKNTFGAPYEPRGHFISRLSLIVRVNVVLNRTVVDDLPYVFK